MNSVYKTRLIIPICQKCHRPAGGQQAVPRDVCNGLFVLEVACLQILHLSQLGCFAGSLAVNCSTARCISISTMWLFQMEKKSFS
jgi:hypothetical protein